jgi:hypothetical protein
MVEKLQNLVLAVELIYLQSNSTLTVRRPKVTAPDQYLPTLCGQLKPAILRNNHLTIIDQLERHRAIVRSTRSPNYFQS